MLIEYQLTTLPTNKIKNKINFLQCNQYLLNKEQMYYVTTMDMLMADGTNR